MKNKEIWKDIVGYEGIYQINTKGEVRKILKHGYKRMKDRPQRNGYRKIGLTKNGKQTTYQVHRLVALCFLPNSQGFPCVNHLDEDKTNNCVDNLEWCSHKYNVNYGTRISRMAETQKTAQKCKPVIGINVTNGLIIEYQSTKEAGRQTGISQGNICSCCHGRLKTAGGYKWMFLGGIYNE